MSSPHDAAPRLAGFALWFVSVLFRTPLLGPALARRIGRDVVDARLRDAALSGDDGGPAPLYTTPPLLRTSPATRAARDGRAPNGDASW